MTYFLTSAAAKQLLVYFMFNLHLFCVHILNYSHKIVQVYNPLKANREQNYHHFHSLCTNESLQLDTGRFVVIVTYCWHLFTTPLRLP